MEKSTAPYGTWRSPISAEFLASAGISLRGLQVEEGITYWVEGRPLEQGRYVIVRRDQAGQTSDVTPSGFNARTLVHEYGGGMFLVHKGVVYFSNFADQRLYRQTPDAPPQPITPEPPQPRSLRYADGRITPDGRWLICVRERHEESGVSNELVALPTDGSAPPHIIAAGYDFYAFPRISPDGRQLAWLAWRHPQLPWDGTELWVAELDTAATLHRPRHLAGSATESIFQPEWRADGVLHFVSDRTNWWNLYRAVDGVIEAIAPMAAEFGGPQWVFGLSQYTFLADGTLAAIYTQQGFDYLGLIAPGSHQIEPIAFPYTTLGSLHSDGNQLWLIAAGPTSAARVITLDPRTGATDTLCVSSRTEIDSRFFAQPEAFAFPTEHDLTAHAIFYPPTNPFFTAPATEQPPLIVICHGGPTGATSTQLNLGILFWTSRGFGVVDVNYGGSTGYGRAYRQRLQGQWGIVDVMDCINAAKHLIATNRADAARVAIRGGSAGGYTTLRALTWQNFFATGASYFGLAELETFVYDTHKFESRYLDYLIGPYPEQKALYAERSPVNAADQLNTPVILLQGLEDKIVPPSQAEIMIEALAKKGLPYAYLAFAGEQHGFRKAENIIRSAEAELYFYGRIFGFAPADEIEPIAIVNL
ncbi:MAG: S9 family peptidase [Caldilineaceae bacterium]|nr:S9 family peptidase [Caldilineaceae bacterium]